MNRDSYLFKEETPQMIERLLKAHMQIDGLENLRLLSGGMFNTTYLIEDTGGRRMILRLGPVQKERVLEYEEKLMEAECRVYEMLRQKDVSVPFPHVLAAGLSGEADGRDFVVTQYMPGKAMCDCKLDENEKQKLYRRIGAYVQELHSIEGDTYGYVAWQLKGERFGTWRSFIEAYVDSTLASGEKYSVFSSQETKDILSIFKKFGSYLDEIRRPHFLHGDVWEGNILVQQTGSGYEVTGILDMDRALYGDIDFEFAANWIPVKPVTEGYELFWDGYERPERELRRKLYQICYAAMTAYVGLAEYANHRQYMDAKEQTQRLCSELMRM